MLIVIRRCLLLVFYLYSFCFYVNSQLALNFDHKIYLHTKKNMEIVDTSLLNDFTIRNQVTSSLGAGIHRVHFKFNGQCLQSVFC